MKLEFAVDRRPLSLQAQPKSKAAWKAYVHQCAAPHWSDEPLRGVRLRCTIVYLSSDAPPDVDNIIKPILDALVGLILDDDVMIEDVHAHRRDLKMRFDLTRLPSLLFSLAVAGTEGIYVKIEDACSLEEELA